MELNIIQNKIYEVRGTRVMLDFDLAALYQVETKRLKEAVRRNIERFEGDDFMFELTEMEYNSLIINLRTQIATSKQGRKKAYAICIYRTGSCDVVQCIKKRNCHNCQSVYNKSICHYAQLYHVHSTP